MHSRSLATMLRPLDWWPSLDFRDAWSVCIIITIVNGLGPSRVFSTHTIVVQQHDKNSNSMCKCKLSAHGNTKMCSVSCAYVATYVLQRWSRGSQESSLCRALVHPLYYLYTYSTFKTYRTSQMPETKQKYHLTHFCELKRGWSYPVSSCICTTQPTKVQLDLTSRNESQTSSLCIGAYAGVKASLFECKYLKKLIDLERLLNIWMSELTRPWIHLNTIESLWPWMTLKDL